MFRSWITLTFRHAAKYGLFTIVNILSLAIGFACCLCILLFVQHELSYDKFHEHSSRIVRITTVSTFNENENRYARTPVPLAELISTEVKEVEKTARLAGREATVFISDRKIKGLERNFFFADPSILSIFTFHYIHGDPSKPIKDGSSVILTETLAKKYFGLAANSIGKTITVENRLELTVSAVIEDWPAASHVRPEMITHFDNYFALEREGIRQYLREDWLYTSVFTYALLHDGASIEAVSRDVNALRERYADDRVKKNVHYKVQPLEDIHLYSNFSFETAGGGIRYVYIFSVVGLLILLIACFNFINLSIARSLKRNKEIGMKKALGLNRKTLIVQLLGESLLYVVIAFFLAMAMVYVLLPLINTIIAKQLSLKGLLSVDTASILLLIVCFTGFMAGAYPAFYISGIDIYKALKGLVLVKSGKFQLRKVLVVLQFLIAITLILFTILVNRQLRFIKDQPLGFDGEHVLTIPLFSDNFNSILGSRIDADYRKRMIAYEESVLQNPRIKAITCSSFLPGQGAITALIRTDSLTEQSNVFIPLVSVDYDFLDAYQVRVLEGRNFSRSFGTDHLQAFIINEEAVKQLGFGTAGKAIGKRLSAVGKDGEVVGVMSNYHIQGLQFALQPLVLEVAASKFSTFSVKIDGSSISESISILKTAWDKFFPESIFEYTFLEEVLSDNYESEQQLAAVIGYFSVFTYIIAGLGLFGLAVYINEQRIKEVGIRKVLGATTSAIFVTLSSDFIRLIVIAFILAIPLSTFLMFSWLENFHYKTTLGFGMFIQVLLSTAFVALITITYQTIRAAQTNPAEVLKSE
jgi:putative ABC transport system permease protein